MKKEFLIHLNEGYRKRKYDLDKIKIEKFIDSFFRFLFFLEYQRCISQYEINNRLETFKIEFKSILKIVIDDTDKIDLTTKIFFDKLPDTYHLLEKDAQFISFYRFAHTLYKENIPLIPRIWTELAHSKTGIDIHPGASIGESFFIDHGTGIVIGETSKIGDFVKIYQNVTLGALAVSKGIANTKRHPTIEDNVTIYAGATILGGKTTIGKGSTIGGNVWITESIAPFSLVYYKDKTIIRSKDKYPEPINFSI